MEKKMYSWRQTVRKVILETEQGYDCALLNHAQYDQEHALTNFDFMLIIVS